MRSAWWEGSAGCRLWQALGGATDSRGRPILGPDDWLVVFVGPEDQAPNATAALRCVGIDSRPCHVPDDHRLVGDPTELAALEARAPDALRAVRELGSLDVANRVLTEEE